MMLTSYVKNVAISQKLLSWMPHLLVSEKSWIYGKILINMQQLLSNQEARKALAITFVFIIINNTGLMTEFLFRTKGVASFCNNFQRKG